VVDLATLLQVRARIERLAGSKRAATSYLQETAQVATRTGDPVNQRNCVEECGYLCAQTGRWAEAVTLWAAHDAYAERSGIPGNPAHDDRPAFMPDVEKALSPAQVRAAEDRGKGMSLATAVEFVTLLTAAQEAETAGGELTERERELVTLVAQGRTNAQIADQLFISIRTVGSHLDRIRDKTGSRRRADLTRLALREGLV
jgi:DNA-binding CsgD family transcriptional regulator